MRAFLGFLICVWAVAWISPVTRAEPADIGADPAIRYGAGVIEVEGASGGASHRFNVEVAESDEARAQGLMYRSSLPDDAGMLFLFPVAQRASFWMKNTVIPLDIIFIGRDRRIINIVHSAEPLSLTLREAEGPTVAVLELNGGTSKRLGIEPGDRVTYWPAK